MRQLGKFVCLLLFSFSLIGCGDSVSEEGAVIPEEDQPTEEELDADAPAPEETP
jgi:hypothetical protein